MKARIERKPLADALARVTSVIPARPFSPVLGAVEITADVAGVSLRATDYDRTLVETLPAEVMAEGTAHVSGQRLKAFVTAASGASVELLHEDSRLHVSSDRARLAAQMFIATEFPKLPDLPPARGTVSTDQLADALARVKHCAPSMNDTAVTDLAGVVLRADDDLLHVQATDRFRVAVVPVAYDGEPFAARLDMTMALAAVKASDADEVSIGLGEHSTALCSGGSVTIGRLASLEKFPDLPRYVGLVSGPVMECDRDDLLDALKQAAIAESEHRGVLIDINDSCAVVRSSDDTGAIEAEIDASSEDTQTLRINPGYLSAALSATSPGRIAITLPPHDRAGVLGITHPDDHDGHAQLIQTMRSTR